MPALTAARKLTSLKRNLLVATALLLGAPVLLAPQERAPQVDNHLRVAQEFLASLYPALVGNDYIMTVETSFRFDAPVDQNIQLDLWVGRGRRGTVGGYMGGYMGQEPPKQRVPAG
jgi:hypothetical protein